MFLEKKESNSKYYQANKDQIKIINPTKTFKKIKIRNITKQTKTKLIQRAGKNTGLRLNLKKILKMFLII